MEYAYASGLTLGLSLIMGFGPQNLFVLQHGLFGRHRLATALTCTACDVLLIVAGAVGLSGWLRSYPSILSAAGIIGGLVLLRMAWATLKESDIPLERDRQAASASAYSVMVSALSVSLANPAAMLDTLVIIGSFVGTQPPSARAAATLGAISASALWFGLLSFGARSLKAFAASTARRRGINLACTAGMLWSALVLLATTLGAAH